jgi:hypothetical protein
VLVVFGTVILPLLLIVLLKAALIQSEASLTMANSALAKTVADGAAQAARPLSPPVPRADKPSKLVLSLSTTCNVPAVKEVLGVAILPESPLAT